MNQVKPKWFTGQIYSKGEEVTNPFSGESYELTALELSIYDFIRGANLILEFDYAKKQNPIRNCEPSTTQFLKSITKDLYKGLDWFKKNNVEAYWALLD